MLKLNTTLDLSGLDRYERYILVQLELFVEKMAYEIKALAQYYVPVDQGVAKASIFVSTGRDSAGSAENLAKALEEATSEGLKNPSKHGHEGRLPQFDLEEVNPSRDLEDYLAYISVAVIYGMALEFGTLQNPDPMSVAATNPGAQRPFLSPAIEYYETMFFDGIKAIMSVN